MNADDFRVGVFHGDEVMPPTEEQRVQGAEREAERMRRFYELQERGRELKNAEAAARAERQAAERRRLAGNRIAAGSVSLASSVPG